MPGVYLRESLPDDLKLSVFAANLGPGILPFTAHWTQDAEGLVNIHQQKNPVSEVILAP
jgi:hypothetical protein